MLTTLSIFMCYSLTQLQWLTVELVQTPQGDRYLMNKATNETVHLVAVTNETGTEVRLCQ